MVRRQEDSEPNGTGGPVADPRTLLRAAADPARYTGFLDTDDDPGAGEAGGTAGPPGPTADPPRPSALGDVAARLAAALMGGDEWEADDHTPGHTPDQAARETQAGAPPTTGDPHHRLRHPLLRAPVTVMPPAPGEHTPARAARYRAHSADLTLTGGLETALAAGPAACALAERYALRRIGGASVAAVIAGAAAAAELGRTAPAPAPQGTVGTGPADAVRPGFAGLAEMVDWLCGDEATDDGPGWRLARMVQPDQRTRALHRLIMAVTRPHRPGLARRPVRVAAAALATLDRAAWSVVALLWSGAVAGWVGVVTAIARSQHVAAVLVPVAAVPLAVTFALAAAFGTLLLGWHATWSGVRAGLGSPGFGLVPGVRAPGDASAGTPHERSRLDRIAGVLPPAGTPALFDWITDRLDDLAGVPTRGEGTARYALTFGELWLGRMGGRASRDLRLLQRSAADPRRRVVDLVLVTTDVSAGRPRLLPFGITERPGQFPEASFLFCRACLVELLPARVVDQMVLMSPDETAPDETAPDDPVAGCPHHRGEPLHHLPRPWDLPVAFAVRLASAIPGVLRPVPLYTPPADGGEPRTHWFSDGAITGGLPMRAFDAPLPWWPTFTVDALDDPDVDDVLVPALDAAPPTGRWVPVHGPGGFAAALARAAAGWRDAVRTQLPGRRGGSAAVRATSGRGPFLDDDEIGRLAVRGYRAGQLLCERFTAPDGTEGFTGSDRFRWIRLRSALSEYRQLSLAIGTSLPLYTDLALGYRVPAGLGDWFSPPLEPGHADPAWGDVVAAVTHLRSLAEGGVLDWDADWGAPPADPHDRLA